MNKPIPKTAKKQAKAKPAATPKPPSSTEVFIYGLYCPVTDDLRYVGKANNVEARLKSHLRDCHTRNTPVYCWIRSLLEKGLVPVVRVIEVANEKTWADSEIRLITQFKASGRLLNVAEGGNQPHQTLEQRQKNALLMNAIIAHRSDKEKALHQAKRRISSYYAEAKRDGKKSGNWSLAERMRLKMVDLAEKRPSMFKLWADLKNESHLQEVAA